METDDSLILKQTKNNGKGVFAGRDFNKGEEIFQFTGPIIRGNENIIPDSYLDNHCVQISKDSYISTSGGPGNFINHSCVPNGGFQIKNERAIIVAIGDIKKGEEITFDYSTSMAEDHYEIDCHCDSKNCRKRIRDFKYLPKNIQDKYIKLGAVPKFVIDSIRKLHEGNKIVKKVVICASAFLYEKAEIWKNKLEDIGYKVIRSIEMIDNNLLSYKKTHIEHYKKIKEADVLFILNLDKNGVKNYIGPSVFAEIAFAIGLNVVFKKNIQVYCLKPLPKNLPYSDELFLWQKLKWIKIWNK